MDIKENSKIIMDIELSHNEHDKILKQTKKHIEFLEQEIINLKFIRKQSKDKVAKMLSPKWQLHLDLEQLETFENLLRNSNMPEFLEQIRKYKIDNHI